MGTLMDILGVAAAGAGGGVLGIVGGLVRQALEWGKARTQAAIDLQVLKERNAHEQALRDKDREILKLEGENAVRVATAQGDAAVDAARMNAIGQSFAADKATFATGESAKDSAWFIFVDVVRGIIRPGLTLLFDLALFAIWGALMWLLWDQLAALIAAQDEAPLALFVEVTKSIVFLATTCTSYWFVARPHADKA